MSKLALSKNHSEPTISDADRPAVEKMSQLLDSKQPKPAILSQCLPSAVLPIDYKFACSTLRLEAPAFRNYNTKHAKPSKQRNLTKSRRSKPKKREHIEALIGGKQKQALQRMKTKHGNTPAQSRAPMRKASSVYCCVPVCCIQRTPKHPYPVPVRLLLVGYID